MPPSRTDLDALAKLKILAKLKGLVLSANLYYAPLQNLLKQTEALEALHVNCSALMDQSEFVPLITETPRLRQLKTLSVTPSGAATRTHLLLGLTELRKLEKLVLVNASMPAEQGGGWETIFLDALPSLKNLELRGTNRHELLTLLRRYAKFRRLSQFKAVLGDNEDASAVLGDFERVDFKLLHLEIEQRHKTVALTIPLQDKIAANLKQLGCGTVISAFTND